MVKGTAPAAMVEGNSTGRNGKKELQVVQWVKKTRQGGMVTTTKLENEGGRGTGWGGGGKEG